MQALKRITPIAITAVAMAAPVQAATITWQPSVNMYQGSTVETFVSTTGTSLVGFNGTNDAANGNVTVNGVPFTQAINGGTVTGGGGESITVNGNNINGNAFQDGEFSSNASIFHLIQGAVWGAGSVDFGGLTIGQEYQIQLFVNDARGNRSLNFIAGVGDGTGSASAVATAELNNSPADGSAPVLPQTEVGDSIIGTFTADAMTQSFNVFGTNSGDPANLAQNDSRAHVNAIQLRAIPEPTSGILAGLAGLGLILRRRR